MSNPKSTGVTKTETAPMNFGGTSTCRVVLISDVDQGVTLCATSQGIADSLIERLVKALNQQAVRHVIFPTETQMFHWFKSVEKFSSCRIITRTQIEQASLGGILSVCDFEERAA